MHSVKYLLSIILSIPSSQRHGFSLPFYSHRFIRENKTNILEFLRNSWANDRRTECSIWMVYSKVDMPHQYVSNGVEGTSLYRSLRGRSSSTRSSNDDVIIQYTLYKIHKLLLSLKLIILLPSYELA